MKDNVTYNQYDNEVMVRTNGDEIHIICNTDSQMDKVVEKMTTDNFKEVEKLWEDEAAQETKEERKDPWRNSKKVFRVGWGGGFRPLDCENHSWNHRNLTRLISSMVCQACEITISYNDME